MVMRSSVYVSTRKTRKLFHGNHLLLSTEEKINLINTSKQYPHISDAKRFDDKVIWQQSRTSEVDGRELL
jgi:hypothetical protein